MTTRAADSAPHVGPRTAVLLGAGASVDAGLPTTVTFARELVDSVRDTFGVMSPLTQTLNFIYGAMLNHRTEQGGDPFAAVNVETMISAIRLLRDRETHEAAPFIQGWKANVGKHRLENVTAPGEVLLTAVRSDNPDFISGSIVGEAVETIVRDIVGDPWNSDLYQRLEEAIRTQVREILLRARDVSYLTPLIDLACTQVGGVDIATLNYDLTVETCAAENGVDADRGADDMPLGAPAGFDTHSLLRLYKIHGSIDLREEPRTASATKAARVTRDASSDKFAPSIVIGDRDKLGSGGRTLALLVSFAQALQDATKLVVVGYSFADPHINAMVTDWLAGDPDRTLVAVDPSWPTTRTPSMDFRAYLTYELSTGGSSRIHVIRGTTANALQHALSIEVPRQPDPRFDVTVTWEGLNATLAIRNPGAAVDEFSLSPGFRGVRPRVVNITRTDAEESLTTHDEWVVPILATGDTVVAQLTYDTSGSLAPIRVDGHDDLKHLQVDIYLEEGGVRLDGPA